VVVRGPETAALAAALKAAGATVAEGQDGELLVSGMELGEVGHLAFTEGAELHELSTRRASLEEAFMSATGASEQFAAHSPTRSVEKGGATHE
jgi:ABC-2 type transport system ATP-binding protein